MAPRNDYLSAACWAVFGVVIVVASGRMDRLENLGINPWSAPGLTPGVVGVLIILLSVVLAWQGRRPQAEEDAVASDEAAAPRQGLARAFLAGLLCVLFAGASLGHGWPFMAEAATFIFLFIAVFSWAQWRESGRIARAVLMALLIAVVAAISISWLFESVFLVRLP